MTDKIVKSAAEWRSELTLEQFGVLRQHSTERPFTGEYVNAKTPGTYLCASCGQALFSSDTKFGVGYGLAQFLGRDRQGQRRTAPRQRL